MFARELLETHQAAAKLRVLFVQMLLATPTCCEVVMTAGSIASFLPVKTFWSLNSLRCHTSLVETAVFSAFRLRERAIMEYVVKEDFLVNHESCLASL